MPKRSNSKRKKRQNIASFTKKIYNICNKPIRKVKANNEMKKAVKEVVAIESARMKKNTKFSIDDLELIITEVAKKNKILERDLKDKVISKDIIVRFINQEINKAFGLAQGDSVIQITTLFIFGSFVCKKSVCASWIAYAKDMA